MTPTTTQPRNAGWRAGKKSPLRVPFAHNVREGRKAMKLSQAGLGELADISDRTIMKIEGGRQNATLDAMDRLAKAFGVTLPVLLSDNPAEQQRFIAHATQRGIELAEQAAQTSESKSLAG